MSHTNTQTVQPGVTVQAVIEAARESCNADTLALYRLTNIIKLAAFAAESRRVLSGIDDALNNSPKASELLNKSIKARMSWSDFDDVTGDVLQDVAAQLNDLNDVMCNRPFELQELGGARHE